MSRRIVGVFTCYEISDSLSVAMKRKTNCAVKLFALSLPILVSGVSRVEAQTALRPEKDSTPSKSILNGNYRQLLARYGEPTAVCFLPESTPNDLFLPKGVTTFSPLKAPVWAKSALFGLSGSQKSLIWLYKRGNDVVVSYLIDPLGYVNASCAIGSGKVPGTAPSQQVGEVTPLTGVALGDDMRRVVFKCGYPDSVRTLSASIHELVYEPREKPKGFVPVYSTVFTLSNGRVARIYTFESFSRSGQSSDENYRLIGCSSFG